MRTTNRLWRPAAAAAAGLALASCVYQTGNLYAAEPNVPAETPPAPSPHPALDALAAVLDDPTASAADRAEAHYDLALLRLAPDSAWRDLPTARRHLGEIDPDAMRRSRRDEVLVLLHLTTELIEKEKAIKAVMQTVIGDDTAPPENPAPPTLPQTPTSE